MFIQQDDGHHDALLTGLSESIVQAGMVQAWVGQKTCKRNILRVFKMSDFINI